MNSPRMDIIRYALHSMARASPRRTATEVCAGGGESRERGAGEGRNCINTQRCWNKSSPCGPSSQAKPSCCHCRMETCFLIPQFRSAVAIPANSIIHSLCLELWGPVHRHPGIKCFITYNQRRFGSGANYREKIVNGPNRPNPKSYSRRSYTTESSHSIMPLLPRYISVFLYGIIYLKPF